jgi:hypothetical protein
MVWFDLIKAIKIPSAPLLRGGASGSGRRQRVEPQAIEVIEENEQGL